MCQAIVKSPLRYLLAIVVIVLIALTLFSLECISVERMVKNLTASERKQTRRLRLLERQKLKGEERLSQMSAITGANMDDLPPRSSNLTAEEFCESPEGGCIPPFRNLETRIRVSEKYHLMTCIVQKSMSTIMQAVMCYLRDEEAFRNASREIVTEWHQGRFCEGDNEYNAVWKTRKALGISKDNPNWRLTMVTREPVDRFLSAFVDRCIRKPTGEGSCNGCKRNMTCFLMTEYERIASQVKSKKVLRSFEDRHFFPQSWRCNLKQELENYRFIRYSSNPSKTFLADFTSIMKDQNVPETSIQYIQLQLQEGRTLHSTVSSEARRFLESRLRSSPFLMELLVRIFYHDFKLFGYSLPTL